MEDRTPRADHGLTLRPERRLIRRTGAGSRRFVLLEVRAGQPVRPAGQRLPVRLCLVIDRSGSMQGIKLETAKRAGLAVLDGLDERDQAALVVFDDRIDTLQPPAPVTPALRAAVREALSTVEARGSTALHEGWLVGCQTIAPAVAGATAASRVFLLTDGQANVGETDPEAIASQVAGVLEKAGIVTSTFGIGDYNEHLLAPMATAGGGQFHHLRRPGEIAQTFLGELGDLLAVAARSVRVEVAAAPGARIEVVSDVQRAQSSNDHQVVLLLGDLLGGESRQIVVRCIFPADTAAVGQQLRARLHWLEGAEERVSAWQSLDFSYADHASCDAERAHRDREVMRVAGLHESYQAQAEASASYHRGDLQGARQVLARTAAAVAGYAPGDATLQEAVQELQAPMAAPAQLADKETFYQAKRRGRGLRDHRGS
jgi:Ca-activated chloride channel family protein